MMQFRCMEMLDLSSFGTTERKELVVYIFLCFYFGLQPGSTV